MRRHVRGLAGGAIVLGCSVLGLTRVPAARGGPVAPVHAARADSATIAETIKGDVARLVAGLNAHDPDRTTAYDDANVISMECGSEATVGIKTDRDGFASGFAKDPHWHVGLIAETVDVARGGDMAVYRGTYHEENGGTARVMTHRTNFIAEFRLQPGGGWKMLWYMVADMERSHPK